MQTKLLYKIGNLYTGYPWGVVVEKIFDNRELHGPFSTKNEANTYAHQLVEDRNRPDDGPVMGVTVVKIETPQDGAVISLDDDGGYTYKVKP